MARLCFLHLHGHVWAVYGTKLKKLTASCGRRSPSTNDFDLHWTLNEQEITLQTQKCMPKHRLVDRLNLFFAILTTNGWALTSFELFWGDLTLF